MRDGGFSYFGTQMKRVVFIVVLNLSVAAAPAVWQRCSVENSAVVKAMLSSCDRAPVQRVRINIHVIKSLLKIVG
jgi:hypothetical protein